MNRHFLLSIALFLVSASLVAQEVPKAEIYAGYSFVRVNPGGVVNPFTTNGGIGSLQFNFTHHLGLVAEFGGYHVGNVSIYQQDRQLDQTQFSYLFGPRVFFNKEGVVSPFIHFLGGGVHNSRSFAIPNVDLPVPLPPIPPGVTVSPGATSTRFRTTQNAAAMAVGGGVDLRAGRHISIRPVQLDYFPTHFSPFDIPGLGTVNSEKWQQNLRYSAGISFLLGVPNPVPPAANCSVQPREVMVGEPITATATASNFNPKHPLSYAWSSNGGQVTGKDNTATIDTTGVAGGSYAVTGHLTDAQMKKGGEASCTASFTVKEPPKNPPTMSCLASPASLLAGTPAAISCTCTSPDRVPVTVGGWSSTGGSVSGSGSTAELNTSGASPGSITVNATCTDSRGLTTAAATSVTVQTPPPPKELEARLALHSIYFPTDMPKAGKPSGGLVESQQKTLLTLASDFQKYLQSRPDAKLILAGHADKRGAADYNMALSQRRVDRTKSFLVENGVPEGNIESKAFGFEENMTPDQVKAAVETNPDLSDEERQRILKNMRTIILASNRRVDVTLSTTGQESIRHFPFNAADSLTLIGGRTAEMKKAPAKKP
jgi:outer membrane protein OmpA-like peptidoglycan-associated protein